jgi:hypothetical protein
MTAMDFPASPLAGDKYPQPPVPNHPVYTFDGVKWTTLGSEADDVIGASVTVPKMDGVAAVGVEGNWSRGDHVHPTDTTRAPIDAPVFTGDARAPTPLVNDNDTTIATTAYVNNAIAASPVGAAAPIDALAYNGMQVNGSMEVSQEIGGTAVSAGNVTKYVIDGWTINTSGSQVLSCAQTTGPAGFTFSLRGTVTTANAAPVAGNYCAFVHLVESNRLSRLAWGGPSASSMTIAFWVRAVRTGTYSGTIANEDSNRCYPFNFTVNLSNVWEYKTVTIPGDINGVWFRVGLLGMRVSFCLMAGATYTAPAGAWVTGTFYGANGTVNAVAATSDAFSITGLVMLPGNVAPQEARSPFIMRPFGQELPLCKRYWESSYDYGTPPAAITTNGASIISSPSSGVALQMIFPFQVSKRAIPAVNTYSPATGVAGKVRDATSGTDVTIGGTFNTGHRSFCIYGTTVAANSNWQAHFIADARL